MEIIGPKYRMDTGIWVQGWFATGIMVLSGLAYATRDFRNLQIIIALGPLIPVAYYWYALFTILPISLLGELLMHVS